jgi:hypothetical protein
MVGTRRARSIIWAICRPGPTLLCLLFVFTSNPVVAQSQNRGDATLRVEYQFIHTDRFFDDLYEFDYWSTDAHVALLSGNYALSDRWSVYGTLPYVQKRFNSEVPPGGFPPNGDPHNPNDPWWIDFQPPDKRFIDDGHYHGGFQDLSFGVMYQALEGPLTISPFIGYGFPTTDYPFYAKAAIGLNLWNIPVGATFSYIPYFSDWYVRGNLAYVFSEKPLDVNVDYWLGHVSTGYWFKPNLSVNLFVSFKWVRDGLKMPWDFTDDPTYGNFPADFDNELWWQHDRLIGHRNVNAGIGFDYFWNQRYKLSGSYFTGVHTEQSNEVDYAITLALTRYFSGDDS